MDTQIKNTLLWETVKTNYIQDYINFVDLLINTDPKINKEILM